MGTLYALCAYISWGIVPLYTQFLEHIGVAEVISHRVLWSLPGAFCAFYCFSGGSSALKSTLTNPKLLAMLIFSTACLATHWGFFVYALLSGEVFLTSFSFFVTPVISVFLGAVFLKERLNFLQIIAALLIILSLLIMTFHSGIPLLSLSIAVTWSAYCFARKTIPVNSSEGFFVEMCILAIPASLYVLWVAFSGGEHFFLKTTSDTLLLMGYGLINSLIFCIFAYGIQRTKLATLGIMEYIAPLLMALIGTFILKQPIDTVRVIVFSIVVVAIIIYLSPTLLDGKNSRKTNN
ncbi:EamA family transporter [Candidatus Liberibacter africanus]|uniref:EamA domain-containing protein n=2 Tax=Liberibacter africanus TaxID=34020 RepID=A0A0G3I368_LIBAF|nr:EamA family transporter [Candidatus Liberibacter africanus]AKK20331.1 hypothetical protein G293_03515 [Candidatus Liberibacter africanus PTSAPSY]